jgi:hypothetical protein
VANGSHDILPMISLESAIGNRRSRSHRSLACRHPGR